MKMFLRLSQIFDGQNDFVTMLITLEHNGIVLDTQFKENVDIISKICLVIEFFAFNRLNLILVDKMQGAQLLMDCLTYHHKIYSQVEP